MYGKVVGVFERNRIEDMKYLVFVCVFDDIFNFLMWFVCRVVLKFNIIYDFKNLNFIFVYKYDL